MLKIGTCHPISTENVKKKNSPIETWNSFQGRFSTVSKRITLLAVKKKKKKNDTIESFNHGDDILTDCRLLKHKQEVLKKANKYQDKRVFKFVHLMNGLSPVVSLAAL